ncbi:hypothetical protein EZV62_028315 [Acer yangbiense]|uniref:Serine-threonine/tyrosine-protein kinase catalytic domain-containing protein n=1 Tax=Acer yangbiense TaxID=1000413 RepID=A0A5C7GNS0_9ROSI|nr:hypothetical protein EZV62_028315 [Acer yangbiense]
MLAKGDIKNIVDPRLQGDYDTNSVWRAVEVAMACVSQSSAKRPTMNQLVIDLNESLAIEIARTNVGRETESKSISLNLHSELRPLARDHFLVLFYDNWNIIDKTVADSLSWEKRLQIATEAALGDIKNVVDPRLHGDFDINSVWKAVEIAMACVSPNSAKRPTMAQVVMELNECLAIQTTDRGEVDDETNLKDYVELVNLNLHSELFPLAR